MWGRRPAKGHCGGEDGLAAPGSEVGGIVTRTLGQATLGSRGGLGGSWVGLRGPEELAQGPQGRLQATGN